MAFLGGSFNPPHVGHAMAAWWVLATQPVDEVWLLPSSFTRSASRSRRGRIGLGCATRGRLHPGGAGLHGGGGAGGDPLVGKTVRTLEHLMAKHPGHRFSLVLGTDIIPETGKWYRFDRVEGWRG